MKQTEIPRGIGREQRLHKVMAQAGVASRRTCEEWIAAGRVAVNGVVVTAPGTSIDPGHDRVEVDGKPISLTPGLVYVMLNKPPGYVSTVRDPHGRPTVLSLVQVAERVYPVGRLDAASEGLMLLTNDGELTQRLTHPQHEHEKEYHVLVDGTPGAAALQQLRDGVRLEDGPTWPAAVDVLRRQRGGAWLRIVIHEGRKHQVRRMCAAIGHPVRRLTRARIGPLRLGDLPSGKWRRLTRAEVHALRAAAGTASRSGEMESRSSQATHRARSAEPDGRRSRQGPQMIAIDGPAAAGKSTVGELLAEELGYLYFDTGVMYRAVTWAAIDRAIAIDDESAVTRLAEQAKIDVVKPTIADGRQYTVLVDGQDVTWDLRKPEVDHAVSPVSAYAGVRAALTAQQRRIGLRGRVVMVGRDIGTVVLPEAPFKLYLDASAEERAKRRHLENLKRGQPSDYEVILAEMRRRDKIDSERATAPLRAAEDAIVLDTTGLGIDEVMRRVHALMESGT